MPRLLALAAALSLLGACSSGSGCDGGDNKPASGEPASLPGGASSRGGPGEAVSFQGLGRKVGGAPAGDTRTAAAAAALGGADGRPAPAAAPKDASGAPQSVLCGGFPYLAADCKTDPVFDQIAKKCCPAGVVDRCEAVPGGARLTGRGCAPAP